MRVQWTSRVGNGEVGVGVGFAFSLIEKRPRVFIFSEVKNRLKESPILSEHLTDLTRTLNRLEPIQDVNRGQVRWDGARCGAATGGTVRHSGRYRDKSEHLIF